MVTTLKKFDRPQMPGWHARFVRRNTTLNRIQNQKRSLRYKRARFYSAQLGRFISRDPLGFMDGMNLYRAYFIPRAMDPMGTICIRCRCHGANRWDQNWAHIDCPTTDVSSCCTTACGGRGWKGQWRICNAIDDDFSGDDPLVDPVDVVCTVIFVVDCATAGPNEGLVVIYAIMTCRNKGGQVVSKQVTKRVTNKKCCSKKKKKKKKGEKTCRCTLRHMPDPDRIKHNCPPRVYATVSNKTSIGVCQAAAKRTAPEACRKYFGHCGWTR